MKMSAWIRIRNKKKSWFRIHNKRMRIHVHIVVGYGLKNYPLRGTFSPELHKQDMYGGKGEGGG